MTWGCECSGRIRLVRREPRSTEGNKAIMLRWFRLEGKDMLYITHNRLREAFKGEAIGQVNRLIDTEVIPALLKVEGVRSVQAYNSIAGEVTFVIDIQNLATVDRMLADPGARPALGKAMGYLVRTGGEVLLDRPSWQQTYGSA